MKNTRSKQGGFTIVEMLIATLVFSALLLVITFAIVRIGQSYYKGVTETHTQDTAHAIMTSISQAIQYNGGSVSAQYNALSGTYVICAGDSRYTARIGKVLVDSSPPDPAKNETNYALMFDTGITNCNAGVPQNMIAPIPPTPPNISQEQLGRLMRIVALTVCTPGLVTADCPTPPALGSNLFQIHLRVVSGIDTVLNAAHDDCDGGSVNQFCAVSDLSTTVEKRIN